jgi:hypothetical protein
MKLYKYSSPDEYIEAQIRGVHDHHTVSDSVNYEWIQKSEVTFLLNDVINPYFEQRDIKPKYGLCHGAKLGKENIWFQEESGFDWIGTDLVVESDDKMNLINWDFHDIKPGWERHFDVIYSNALDHSHTPKLALENWLTCLNSEGICILEHTTCHEESNAVDPYGATFDEYKELAIESNGEIVMDTKFTSTRLKNFLIIKYKK